MVFIVSYPELEVEKTCVVKKPIDLRLRPSRICQLKRYVKNVFFFLERQMFFGSFHMRIMLLNKRNGLWGEICFVSECKDAVCGGWQTTRQNIVVVNLKLHCYTKSCVLQEMF